MQVEVLFFLEGTLQMHELKNVDDVIKKAGGAPGLAALTQRKTQAVWNWRFRGHIPPQLWLIISSALSECGYKVAHEIFKFEPIDRAALLRWKARLRHRHRK